MKLLLSLFFSFLTSVSFLLYLSTVQTFLPFLENGSYNWANILTIVILLCVSVFSFLGLVISAVQIPFKKSITNISWYTSIKYAGIATLLLLALSILSFFHILTWYWVLSLCLLLGILIVTV